MNEQQQSSGGTGRVTVSGVFAYRDRVLEAIARLREAGFATMELFSPVPDHQLIEALPRRRTPVGLFTLLGGLFGLAFGFGGASYCHLVWNTIVGGKPVISIPPFVVVAFEMTILFGGLATLAGVFMLCRLPRLRFDVHFDPRATEDHYVLVVETDEERADDAYDVLQECGGEVGGCVRSS